MRSSILVRALLPAKERHDLITRPDPGFDSGTAVKRLLICSSKEARALIPLHQAERLTVLPLSILRQPSGEELLVVMGLNEPLPDLVQELRFTAGLPVVYEPTEDRETLIAAISAAYRGDVEFLSGAAKFVTTHLPEKEKPDGGTALRAASEGAPIPKLLEAVLSRAYYLSASDVHIEPQLEDVRIRFRVDGLLRDETAVRLSSRVLENLARHIKVVCGLDLTEKRKPQDGSFQLPLKDESLRVRVSFLPQRETERIVLRLFPMGKKDLPSEARPAERFSALGLSPEQQRMLLSHLGLTGGTLIFSGPTGSGKTTLLYGCLEFLNEEWRNVVTIEDPIEKTIPGINQTQVTPLLGFRDCLPVVLRQDPDVVMVGEIRDSQTADSALTAGITGHLVLSTVHAGSCIEIIPRLRYLGVQGLLLGASLRLLVAQRLLPRNCIECREEKLPTNAIAKFFHIPQGRALLSSRGCSICGNTGIRGRRGVFEFLPVSPSIQELLFDSGAQESGALIQQIKQKARQDGFQPLAFQIREALLEGVISPHSAFRGLGLEPRLFEL